MFSYFFPLSLSFFFLYSIDTILTSYQCSHHVNIFLLVIRIECHSWCRSVCHGGWCAALSTVNSLLRFRRSTTWTSTTSSSWPRKSLTSQTLLTTSATWWFPGLSLTRYVYVYVLSHRHTHSYLTLFLNLTGGSPRSTIHFLAVVWRSNGPDQKAPENLLERRVRKSLCSFSCEY